MPSKAIMRHPKTYYPYVEGEKVYRSSELTEKVCAYQSTKTGRKQLMDELSCFVYSYPVDKRLVTEEEASDFFIYFLPTLEYIIAKFSFQGYPVEQYLIRCIRYRISNFKKSKSSRRFEQNVIAHHEQDPWYEEHFSEEVQDACSVPRLYRDPSSRRWYVDFSDGLHNHSMQADKLLMLILRHALVLSSSLIEKCDCLFSGYPGLEKPLGEIINTLRRQNERKLERQQQMRDSRSRMFALLIRSETDLLFCTDGAKRSQLQAIITSRRLLYNAAGDRMENLNMYIPHHQIAAALHIPKGTVDSGLFYVKKKHKTLLDALD
jgi:hypothetical protein